MKKKKEKKIRAVSPTPLPQGNCTIAKTSTRITHIFNEILRCNCIKSTIRGQRQRHEEWTTTSKGISFLNQIIELLVNPIEQCLRWALVDPRRVVDCRTPRVATRRPRALFGDRPLNALIRQRKKKIRINVAPVDGPLVSLQSILEYSPFRPSTNCQTVLISSSETNNPHASLAAWVSRRGRSR